MQKVLAMTKFACWTVAGLGLVCMSGGADVPAAATLEPFPPDEQLGELASPAWSVLFDIWGYVPFDHNYPARIPPEHREILSGFMGRPVSGVRQRRAGRPVHHRRVRNGRETHEPPRGAGTSRSAATARVYTASTLAVRRRFRPANAATP